MKHPRTIALATCLMTASLVSANATPPPVEPDGPDGTPAAIVTAEAAAEPRQICRLEKVTGTQRATRICRSVEQSKRDRDNALKLVGSRGMPPPPWDR